MSAAKSGERAGFFLVSDLGTARDPRRFSSVHSPSAVSRAISRQPVRKRSAKPEAAEHEGEQSDLRAAARSRVVCARAAPDRVFLSLTPSHFFPAVGNGGAPGS